MKRAGLDYHELTMFETYTSWDDFLTQSAPEPSRAFALTTKGTRRPDQVSFQKGDWLIFGSETKGLGEKLAWFDDAQRLRLAMRPGNRSLNLSNAVAVTAYEAWRQLGFCGGD